MWNRRETTVEVWGKVVSSVFTDYLGDNTGTYPLLPVYTPLVCAKSEVLLTTKSDAVGLGGIEVIESFDSRLLFVRAKLHREIAGREMSGRVQAVSSESTIR